MKSLVDIILWSSKNPNKISLTIKAGVPFIVAILAMFNIHTDINPIIDELIIVVNALLVVITGVATMWGLIRKAYLTWKNDNQIVSDS